MIFSRRLRKIFFKKSPAVISKAKNFAVSFKVSILSIFFSIFVIYTMAVMYSISYHFSLTISSAAFNLMGELSDSLFEKINSTIKRTASLSELSGHLIANNIIAQTDLPRIMEYTFHYLSQERHLYPSSAVEGVAWSDQKGNFVWSQIQQDKTVMSEIINRTNGPKKATYYYRDVQGKIIKTVNSKFPADLNYLGYERPWYKQAMKYGKTALTNAGLYTDGIHFGMSIVTPVFTESKQPLGVFEVDFQLLFLRNFIDGLKVSKNGLIFIFNQREQLLAFPHIVPYRGTTLLTVRDISYPWVTQSIDEYNRTKAKKFIFKYNGSKYFAVYQRIPRPEINNDLIIGVIAPEDDFLGDLYQLYLSTMGFSIFIFFIGLLLVSYLVSQLVKPLKKITQDITRIKNFDLTGNSLVPSRVSEINAISDTVQAMKIGLRAFQKYVPAMLVKQLIKLGVDAHIGGEKRKLVIFFSDIQNFTSLSENEDPEQLSQHLCDYLSLLSDIILDEKGTIDKYIGDSVMAFWGAPIKYRSESRLAVNAALRCKKKLNELNKKWKQENKPIFMTCMGIHKGYAIVGNIGSNDRMNYTVIGDAVNHASRLEGVNRHYGTQILVSRTIYDELKNQFYFRFIDRVHLRGRVELEDIYEVLAATREEIPFDLERYTENFEAGFLCYKNQTWSDAVGFFKACIVFYPEDTVAPVFIARCEVFIINPPGEAWKGTFDA